MKLHIIEVIKEKQPYHGTSSRGPYTIYSKRVLCAVDGGPEVKAQVKTFDDKKNASAVNGTFWSVKLSKDDPQYGAEYTLEKLEEGGIGDAAPARASSPAPSGNRDLVIQAQTCLKAATDLVAATLTPDDNKRLVIATEEALQVADSMLAWVESRGRGEKSVKNTDVPDDLPFGDKG